MLFARIVFKLVPQESLPNMQKPTENLPLQFRVILQNSYHFTLSHASLCFVNDSINLFLPCAVELLNILPPMSLALCVCVCMYVHVRACTVCMCIFVCVCMCMCTHISILLYVCSRCPKYSGQLYCAAVARCISEKQTCCPWQSNSSPVHYPGKAHGAPLSLQFMLFLSCTCVAPTSTGRFNTIVCN